MVKKSPHLVVVEHPISVLAGVPIFAERHLWDLYHAENSDFSNYIGYNSWTAECSATKTHTKSVKVVDAAKISGPCLQPALTAFKHPQHQQTLTVASV